MRAKYVNEIKKSKADVFGGLGIGRLGLFKQMLRDYRLKESDAFLYDDNTFDYGGNVDLDKMGLSTLVYAGTFRFGKVLGYFWCDNNNLRTLEGAPREVQTSFSCQSNGLVSLEGSPEIIKFNFYCNLNDLTTLRGGPRIVEGTFSCRSNLLTDLGGAPEKVGSNFLCGGNKHNFTKEYVKKMVDVGGEIFV